MQTRWLGVALVAAALMMSVAVGCNKEESVMPAETPAVAPAETAMQDEAAVSTEDEQSEETAETMETTAEEAPAH